MNYTFDNGLKEFKSWENLLYTFSKVYKSYEDLFGKEIMNKARIFIDNVANPKSSQSGHTPIIFKITNDAFLIKLNVPEFSDTQKITYQLAHELTHYVFYVLMEFKKPHADFTEESICSAASLVFINDYFSDEILDHWCEYVKQVRIDHYREGYTVAKKIGFDMVKLKELIYEKANN